MNDLVKEEKLTTAEIAAARPRGEAIEKASDRALGSTEDLRLALQR